MATVNVTQEQILEALQRLPGDRWTEVLSFIDSLERKEAGTPIRTARDLVQSDIIGIWANRTDLEDSQSFARQLRKRAENRGADSNAPGH